MPEIEVPGTSLAAREENDVHRANSATGTCGYRSPPLMILGSIVCFKELAHGWHPRRPLPRAPCEAKPQRPSRRETMPKTPRRDKQTVRQGSPPRSVGDLISARLPTLVEGAPSTSETSEWHVAVMKALGPELAVKVNRCSLDSGRITVVAESSAWAARMRFALAEVEPTLRDTGPRISRAERAGPAQERVPPAALRAPGPPPTGLRFRRSSAGRRRDSPRAPTAPCRSATGSRCPWRPCRSRR